MEKRKDSGGERKTHQRISFWHCRGTTKLTSLVSWTKVSREEAEDDDGEEEEGKVDWQERGLAISFLLCLVLSLHTLTSIVAASTKNPPPNQKKNFPQ